jgi:hypothetical protein
VLSCPIHVRARWRQDKSKKETQKATPSPSFVFAHLHIHKDMHTHIYTCNLCVMHMLSLSLLWVSLFTFFASIFPSFMAPTLCTHKTNALPINELLKRTRSYTFAIPRSLPHLADPSALFFFFSLLALISYHHPRPTTVAASRLVRQLPAVLVAPLLRPLRL